MPILPSRGLYAVTSDRVIARDEIVSAVSAVLRGGAAMIQYRAKGPHASDDVALELLSLCHDAGVPLIINDDVDRALRVGADGVHLGRHDVSLSDAQHRLGSTAIIGVSCYDCLERARWAQAEGASYVAFGRFYPSSTKPEAPLAQIETLDSARAELGVPIVAIGGITPDNGRQLIERGAGLLAVVEGVFGASDPEQAASQFKNLWDLSDQSQLKAPPV